MNNVVPLPTALPPIDEVTFMADASAIRHNQDVGNQLAALHIMLPWLSVPNSDYWQDRYGLMEICSRHHELELWDDRKSVARTGDQVRRYLQFEDAMNNISMPLKYIANECWHLSQKANNEVVHQHMYQNEEMKEWPAAKRLYQSPRSPGYPPLSLIGSVNSGVRSAAYIISSAIDHARNDSQFAKSLTDDDLQYLQLKRGEFNRLLHDRGPPMMWHNIKMHDKPDVLTGRLVSSPFMLSSEALGKYDPVTKADRRTVAGKQYARAFADLGEKSIALHVTNHSKSKSGDEQARHPFIVVMDDGGALAMFRDKVTKDYPHAVALSSVELAHLVQKTYDLLPGNKKKKLEKVLPDAKEIIAKAEETARNGYFYSEADHQVIPAIHNHPRELEQQGKFMARLRAQAKNPPNRTTS
jgi:hypothetical protein